MLTLILFQSHRQYTSQFQRWNLRKYGQPQSNNPRTSDPVVDLPSSVPAFGPYSDGPSHPGASKRQRSNLSLSSTQSSRSRPPVPAKKPKLQAFLAQKNGQQDPYAGLGDCFDTRMTAEPQEDRARSLRASIISDVDARPSSIQHPAPVEDRHDLERNDRCVFSTTTSVARDVPDHTMRNVDSVAHDPFAEPKTAPMSSRATLNSVSVCDVASESQVSIAGPSSSPGHRWRGGPPFCPSQRWSSVQEVSRYAKKVQSNRPIQEFSEEEILDLRMAADYLQILHFDDEASYLYAPVIQWYQADTRGRERTVFITTILHAYAAISENHQEIVQNLLITELNKASSPLMKFLSHMMLAYTYARRGGLHEKAVEHLEAARHCSLAHDIFSMLPDDYRAFDLFTVQNLALCKSLPRRPLRPEDVTVFDKDLGELADGLQLSIFNRVPGPFEIKDGVMHNPCIRSCVRWCLDQLLTASSLPVTWKYKKLSRDDNFLAETITVFTYLFDRARDPRPSATDPSLALWITDTEPRMGIPSTYLLMFLCRMAFQTKESKRSRSSTELIRNTIERFRVLSNASDRDLAVSCLAKFVNFHTFFNWSSKRMEIQELSREHVVGVLQNALMVIVPDLKSMGVSFAEGASNQLQALNNAVTLSAPLESDSLQKMRGKLQQSMSSLSPNRIQEAAANNASITRLSSALANSLSISDAQRRSMSIDSQWGTFSSSIRELMEYYQ
jgi:hypothetical protein